MPLNRPDAVVAEQPRRNSKRLSVGPDQSVMQHLFCEVRSSFISMTDIINELTMLESSVFPKRVSNYSRRSYHRKNRHFYKAKQNKH